MRRVFVLALFLLATQTVHLSQAPGAVLQGTVTRAESGGPVPFAQIVLNIAAPSGVAQSPLNQFLAMPMEVLQANIDRAKAQGNAQTLALMTEAQSLRLSRPNFPVRIAADASGRFAIPNLLPGDYRLTAQREGYFAKPVDDKAPITDAVNVPISVSAPGVVSEVAVSMLAGAVIQGTVRGTDGAPLPNVNVQVFTQTPERVVAVPASQGASVKTNELGEYRLYWLRPGNYVVGANPPVRPFTVDLPGVAPPEPYVRTYFPDATEPNIAVPLSLKPGDEVRDINITLRTGGVTLPGGATPGTPTYKISGRVVNTVRRPADVAGESVPTTATLVLAPRGSTGSVRGVGAVAIPPQTPAFEISGVAPGSYDLFVRMPDGVASAGRGPGRGLYVWGRAAIEVTNRDVTDVTLTIHSPVDVNGRLTIDGAAPKADLKLEVFFQVDGAAAGFPNYHGANFGPQTPGESGMFTIPNAAEGNYQARVSGLNPNWYVADVLAGGVTVYDSGFQVADKAPGLVEIKVATNGGVVEGVLMGATNAPEPFTRVVLVPPASHRGNEALFKMATTNAQGQFVFRGIRPDDYKIFAWEGMPSVFRVTPELLARSEAQGFEVKVAPSATARVQVPLIPKPAQ